MAAFLEAAQSWANTVLVWIGFGTVVGLTAKALMPGRDQGGTLATLFMGIGGTVVGLGTLSYIGGGHRVTPVSILGFLAATGGAFLLLFFHKMLQGSFFREEGTGPIIPKRRQKATVVVREQ